MPTALTSLRRHARSLAAASSPRSPPRRRSSWTASACRPRPTRPRELAERIRTALLAAVSHDLRTPLTGIKASVSSLRSDDVEWSEEDQAELLAAIEEGADRLEHLVLTMSLDFETHGIGKVLVPLVVRPHVRKEMPRNEQTLKRLLEGSA